MRKYLALILALCACACLPACGADASQKGKFSSVITEASPTNVLAFIPNTLHAAIAAKTDNTNLGAYVREGIDNVSSRGGGVLFFPLGKYVVDYLDIPSNVQIVGEGWGSEIHQNAGYVPRVQVGGTDTDGMLSINHDLSQTPVKNVVIRDIKLSCDSITGSYNAAIDEFVHLVMIGHAEDVVIERVFFYGWRGDAVMAGFQIAGGSPVGLVMKGLRIQDCVFDGVNHKTRQGISLGSVDGVIIDGNRFYRMAENEPGAIDVEPELAPSYVRDITVTNNYFEDIGVAGARKAAFVVDLGNLDNTYYERRGRITFAGNYADNTGGVVLKGANTAVVPQVFTVRDNYFRNTSWTAGNPFYFLPVDGLIIDGNVFDNVVGFLIGYQGGTTDGKRIKVTNNVFNKCGTEAACIAIASGLDMEISGNDFLDCGLSTGGSSAVAIRLQASGASSSLRIFNNVFESPLGITYRSLDADASHSQDNVWSVFRDNIHLDNVLGPSGWTANLNSIDPVFTGYVKAKGGDNTFASVDQTNTGIFSTGGSHTGGTIVIPNDNSITLTLGNMYALVSVTNTNTGNGALFSITYASDNVVSLADVGSEWVTTDTDSSKLAIYKSAGSYVVTIKNYANTSRSLAINIVGSTVSSSTAPQ